MPQQCEKYQRSELHDEYKNIRRTTAKLCEPLITEDYGIQSMPEASPAKWHLAHTSWFFERFILARHASNYRLFHPKYDHLFNSYYESIGTRIERHQRGLLSRPSVSEIYEYRTHVDRAISDLIDASDGRSLEDIEPLIVVGLHHEQQHQELLLTDIKSVFAFNPLRPVFNKGNEGKTAAARNLMSIASSSCSDDDERWLESDGGLVPIGYDGRRGGGFSFDNEGPQHKVFLQAFRMQPKLVTNSEFVEFIESGGYDDPAHWLSDGWAACQRHQWRAPLYWENIEGRWWSMTLNGMQQIRLDEPVCHVSFYEANAFAKWAGKRLPTEIEWEHIAQAEPISGNFADDEIYHPIGSQGKNRQFFGDVWEWTMSAYQPYPGFIPASGALGEYNGKFMCNQIVLRGGSCATPRSHIRATYRNFFSPESRWQFSGFRLADSF